MRRIFPGTNGLWPFRNAVFLLLVLFPFTAISQNNRYDNWEVKDGLPQNSINRILQTRDGYLWLATEGGLVRFDGIKFTVFDTQNTPALKSNRIKALVENANGDLLIGSDKGGLILYRSQHFYDISSLLKIEDCSINQFFLDSQKRLWILTKEKGVIVTDRQNYKRATEFDVLQENNVQTVCEIDGEYILVTFNNIVIWKAGSYRIEPAYPANGDQTPLGPAATQNGFFYLLSHNGLYKYKNHKLTGKYPLPLEHPEKKYNFKIHNLGDKLIVSVIGGSQLIDFDTNTNAFTVHNDDFGCSPGSIRDVFTDAEGNKWYATASCGLIREKPHRFVDVSDTPQIKNRNFYPVFKDRKGNVFLGSNGSGFYTLDKNLKPIRQNLPDEVSTYSILTIAEHDGALYFGMSGKSFILKLKDGVYSKIQFPDAAILHAHALYETRSNELLVGWGDNILTLSKGKLVYHPLSGHFKGSDVLNFFEDRRGKLWVVSEKKVGCYHPGKHKAVFYQNRAAKSCFFRGITEDAEGRIYVGSYGTGLHILEKGKCYTLNKTHGLPENVISFIAEDRRGNIWLTGNKGLTRVRKKELVEICHGTRKQLNATLYDERTDRLFSSEFNGGSQNPGCLLEKESYLLPTLNGCVKVNFADMDENLLPPPVHIEQLRYKDSVFLPKEKLSLPYSEQRLEIGYTALSFVSPRDVRFRYKLEGYDDNWIEAGRERKVTYPKLPPGHYVFKVMASNNEGIWNKKGDSLAIDIIPPFYMTWWARFSLFLLLVVSLFILAYNIVSRTRKRERNRSALMDVLPDLVIKLDKFGRYVDVYGNPSALIRPMALLKGKEIRHFLPPEASDKAYDNIKKALATRKMQVYEYELTLSDGILRTFEGRVIAIDRHEVLFIIRDISEAQQAREKILDKEKLLVKALKKEKKLLTKIQQQQKWQLEAIVNTEERERRRIAADLHDGVGQLLSRLKMNLSAAQEKINRKELSQADEIVAQSKMELDAITDEIRSISYNLLPPSLRQFGLVLAMEEEVNKLKNQPGIFIHFDKSVIDEKFEGKIEIIVFRIFQEILNNALKHSHATEITIQVIQHEGEITLMVEDNGKGFNFNDGLRKAGSSGLKNIFSRTELLNGRVKIDSSPHSGTSITVQIPI